MLAVTPQSQQLLVSVMLLSEVPFIPQLFLSYMSEAFATKSRLVNSGIMSTNSAIQAEFLKGGSTIDLPFFSDLSGDSEVLDDTVGLTPASLGGGVQRGVRQNKGRAWQGSDLAAELAGSDPIRHIASRVGVYWTRELQKSMIAILNGLFGASGALEGTHTAGGTDVQLAASVLLDGFAKLGDEGEGLSGIIMHSAVFYALAKADLLVGPGFSTAQIDTRVSAERPEFPTFYGRQVLVDDTMTVDAGAGTGGGAGADVYNTYLFAPGAFSYAMCPAKTPTEIDRDSLKGIEYLINRNEFMVHPNGCNWAGTAAKQGGPNLTELATPANWTKVFSDDKNIKIVEVQTYL